MLEEDLAAQSITRYVDIGKFTAMLYEGGLFFSSYDYLGDPHEGALGHADQALARLRAEHDFPDLSAQDAFSRWLKESWASDLLSVAVSCWYEGDVESNAMWHGYGASIAIESTVGTVLSALDSRNVSVARVEYLKYEERPCTDLNPMKVLSYKRPQFATEHESRFFCLLQPEEAKGVMALRELPYTRVRDHRKNGLLVYRDGIMATAQWAKIIKSIRLTPGASRWLRYAVTHLANTNGFSHQLIATSELDREPYDDRSATEEW